MCSSTRALCQWDFTHAQDTGNKCFEAEGVIWEKCFLPSEQCLLAGVSCHMIIYHS